MPQILLLYDQRNTISVILCLGSARSKRTNLPSACASLMRGRRSASYVSSASGTPSGRPPVRAKQRAIAAASSIACEPPWKAVGCARERNQQGLPYRQTG